jgi:hypothetical protein
LEEEEEMSPNLQEEIIQGILSAAKGMYWSPTDNAD